MILNILSGMAMYQFFNENCFIDGELIPFNEAMCEGSASNNIFSSEFIDERCATHMTEQEDYENLVIEPMRSFFNQEFSKVVFWFDEDMFCMVNLLTLLGYLDMTGNRAEVVVNIVDGEYNVGYSAKVDTKGFYELYKEVMVRRIKPTKPLPKILERGVNLLIEYKSDGNRIENYIRENINRDEEELLSELFAKFSEFGLGDLQYLSMITRIKNNI